MDFPHPGRTPSVIASLICPRDHRAEDDDVSAGSRDPNRKCPSAVGRRNNEFLLWKARPNQDRAFISGAPVRIGRSERGMGMGTAWGMTHVRLGENPDVGINLGHSTPLSRGNLPPSRLGALDIPSCQAHDDLFPLGV